MNNRGAGIRLMLGPIPESQRQDQEASHARQEPDNAELLTKPIPDAMRDSVC